MIIIEAIRIGEMLAAISAIRTKAQAP